MYRFLLASGLLAFAATGELAAQEPTDTVPSRPLVVLESPMTISVSIDTVAVIEERYVPHRVYDSRKKRMVDFETMLSQLVREEVVFLGEQHDDPGTHRLQLAVLEGLDRRREGQLLLSLEMFERDVQPVLNSYLAGQLGEEEFLGGSRPWGNYRADYRPMVEYARERGWPVLAANVPRPVAQAVSRGGLGVLDTAQSISRAHAASDILCPRDDYWKRFSETMGDMGGHGMQLSREQLDAMVWRFYEAQCIKDETMAESIVNEIASRGLPVVHANGAFHSNYHLGTVARVKRRLPRARISVVTFVPVSDLDAVRGGDHRKLGDWVVFTLAPVKGER